jgi:hypothetical protein
MGLVAAAGVLLPVLSEDSHAARKHARFEIVAFFGYKTFHERSSD